MSVGPGSDQFWTFQIGSSCIRLVLTSSNKIQPVQTSSDWFKLVQTHLDQCELVGSSLDQKLWHRVIVTSFDLYFWKFLWTWSYKALCNVWITNQINQSILRRALYKCVNAASSTVRGAVRRIGCLSDHS